MADHEKAAGIELRPRPELGKLTLRATDEVAKLAADVLGRPWPAAINRAAGEVDDRTLRLGPDEFLMLVARTTVAGLVDRLRPALADHHHALVDVSARLTALELSGPMVRQALAAACPLDLHDSSFAVDAATRTMLGKPEIVLDRLAADRWRLAVNRSLAPYVEALLHEAGREFGVRTRSP
ncbi:MAG: sarcosine oxidase subunit gamma family protein [Geminicoccaceae bacterium]